MATHILSEETITTADLQAALLVAQERDQELNFRAGKTLDHLNHIPLVAKEKKDALFAKIMDLGVPRLKEQHAHKIIDLQPASVKELAVILSGYTLSVSKEYQQKLIEALEA